MLEILTIIVILLWIVPFAIKAKIGWSTIARMIAGVLVGGIPVIIGAMILNNLVEVRLLPVLNINIEASIALQALCTGFIEEGLKFLGALLVSIKMKSKRPIDYILVFGSVGAGFEIIESVAAASDFISLIFRTLLALHVLWLYHQGSQYFLQKEGKKLAIVKSYITVALLHGAFDFGPLLIGLNEADDTALAIGAIGLVIGLIINIVFIIKTIKKVNTEASIINPSQK